MRKKRKLRARAVEAAQVAEDHALAEVAEALEAEALDEAVKEARSAAGVGGELDREGGDAAASAEGADETDDVEVRGDDAEAGLEAGGAASGDATGEESADDAGEADEGGEAEQSEGALHARDMADEEFQCLVESLLFAADKPLQVTRIRQLTGERNLGRIEAALAAIAEFYAPRGMVLHSISGAHQFRTHPRFSAWVQQLIAGRPVRLSRAQLETLAIIAYRQPITRPEIDDIRGVDSGGTLKVLLDRTLIRILGKKEEPGRPLLYGTTKEFLEFFNLNELRDLPTLREYHELSEDSMKIVEKAGHDAPAGSGTIDELVQAANAARAAREQAALDEEAAEQEAVRAEEAAAEQTEFAQAAAEQAARLAEEAVAEDVVDEADADDEALAAAGDDDEVDADDGEGAEDEALYAESDDEVDADDGEGAEDEALYAEDDDAEGLAVAAEEADPALETAEDAAETDLGGEEDGDVPAELLAETADDSSHELDHETN